MQYRRMTALALLVFGACGDSSQTYTLADGTTVEVTEGGAISLSVDGRTLWETSRADRPTVKSFDEEAAGALAIWEFTRSNETVIELGRFAGAEETADGLVLTYDSGDGGISGTITLTPDDGATRVTFDAGSGHDSLALPVRCSGDTTFFGFGEQYNATEQTGEKFTLIVSEQGIGRTGSPRALSGDEHTTYFPMPYYVDARGFGVLVDTDHRVEVDICRASDKTAWLEVVDGAPIELTVFHGPTPKDVIRQLGDRVGRPALPPDWAFELWISSQGGRDAVMADVAALEDAEIPVAAIWSQDWTGVRMNADGGLGVQYRWEADLDHYPDLAGMIDDLHGRGIKFLAYANPFVVPSLPNHFDEMDAAGLLIQEDNGDSYVPIAPNGRASMPDFTNPDAVAYVGDAFRAMVNDYGIDGWMADFGEWLPLDAVLSDGTDPRAYHNRYPVDWHASWRQVMDELDPPDGYAVFARSGWTGVHAHSQIHWIGDQETGWSIEDGLPTVVPAMLNLGLAGIPYVTHDIGGFSSLEGTRSKELFLRWTELGAFTPIMRTHEGAFRDDNWSWDSDAETTAHFRRFARIHQALADEIRALAAEAQTSSAPIVRHLMLEYPDDPNTYGIHDQYLLGPDLLVAPVVTEGATSRELYLPEGTWYHVFTGESFEGGRTVEVDAPIGTPPVFSRGADRTDLRAIE